MAISLMATRWSHQQTQQERCEGIMSITTILIPQRQLSLQERQSP
jgi:hypothetical protein